MIEEIADISDQPGATQRQPSQSAKLVHLKPVEKRRHIVFEYEDDKGADTEVDEIRQPSQLVESVPAAPAVQRQHIFFPSEDEGATADVGDGRQPFRSAESFPSAPVD